MSGGLERFIKAQNAEHAGYDAALAEIRQGRKRSHWIWYVFPQLAGLGFSPAAQAFGVAGRSEALAYLRHPLLRDRLLEITTAAADQLREGIPIATLMGSDIDAKKLVSSLTLFHGVAGGLDPAVETAAASVLAQAEAQGYPPCEFTRAELRRSR